MTPPAPATDAAIVGMACLFPGAPDLATYWRNIVGKVDAVGDPPEDWDAERVYDPSSSANDRIYCKRGGYLGDLATFDPLAYGVMPSSVDGGEPDQYLALRVAYEAMDDAGFLTRDFDHDRAEVVVGRGTYINRGFTNVVQHGLAVEQALSILRRLHPEHTDDELAALKRELKATLPPFNADMAPGLVPNIMTGRIANRLDLRGANYTIDAACASSLVALDRAMQDLRDDRCDIALVGGVHCSTPAQILMIFCQLGALSRSGTMRPFDRRADGTLLGEGAGFLVLRRRGDAERDGDRIYAVARAVGTASDGRGLGMLAPRVDGEVLALRRAYEAADVSPRTVGLLEAHGTGTPVGDATEIEALARVLGDRDGEPPWCALGCVKSMISHLIPAAGVAGIIKAALALHHKVLPPTLHCEEPNPALGMDRTPLYLNTETRPWIHGGPEPRRAGVDAFGFGGINTHALLEEHVAASGPPAPQDVLLWDSEVLVIEGGSRAELVDRAGRVERFLAAEPNVLLRDVAATLNVALGDDAGRERLAVVAATAGDARTRLSAAIQRLREPDRTRLRDSAGAFYEARPLGRSDGAVAFVFPGEGSQYPGMLEALCLHFPEARASFDAVDRAFAGHRAGPPPSRIVFPPPGTDEEAATERLWRMDGAGEALFAADQAVFAVLTALGIRPGAVVGHSSGEYPALLAAGALSLDGEDQIAASMRALNAVYTAAESNGGIPRAALVAIASADPAVVEAIVRDGAGELFVAMDNCPHQVVLCGAREAVASAVARLRELGAVCSELPFDRPYHTPLFAGFAEALEKHFATLPFTVPRLALWSCATAARVPQDAADVRRLALEQWSRPVRFRQTVEAMYEDRIRVFVECGPRGNLTAFVDDVLRGVTHVALAADLPGRPGLRQLNDCLAQLAVHGVPIDFAGLYARRAAQTLDLDEPRGAARAPVRPQPPPLATAMPSLRVDRRGSEGRTPAPIAAAEAVPDTAAGPASSDGQVLEAYFATMERFLDAQERVMQTLLGGGAPAERPVLPAPSRTGLVAHHDEALEEAQPATAAPAAGPQLGAVDAAAPAAAPAPGPQRDAVDAVPAAGPAAGPRGRDTIEAALRALISERTGYPPAAIESELNLEADLGVDSIKRIEILETYRAQTGAILDADLDQLGRRRTLAELVEAIAGSAPNGGGPAEGPPVASDAAPGATPLIAAVEALTPGRAVTARCELRLQEHRFLCDHTLETQPIAMNDAALVGLPIMPLTFSMELLAEAASLLRPGERVVGMRDVRATRWVAVRDEPLVLEVQARAEDGGDVRAELRERTGGGAPVVTAVVELAADRRPAPAAQPLALTGERPSRWTQRPLYGGTAMFHGPAYQAVRSIDRSGEDGIEASLVMPLAGLVLRSQAEPAFLIDPVLLDAMGQVVAYWVGDRYDRAVNIFPFRLERLVLHGQGTVAGTTASCRVRVRHVDDHGLRSDVEVVDAGNAPLAVMTGWEDRRMDLPPALREFLASPRDASLSRPCDVLPGDADTTATGRWHARVVDGLATELLEAHGGIWLDVLAHVVLGRDERQRWRELSDAPGKRRRDWLRGRIAAKDAIRQLVAEETGERICAADVEIRADQHGRPEVVAPVLDRRPVSVTITHAADAAAALACVGTDATGGIDIEPAGDLAPAVHRAAFTPGEAALVGELPGADAWPVRLWCAKEAAGKASGRGLGGDPRSIEVLDVDAASGVASVALPDGQRLSVHTAIECGLAYAACIKQTESEVPT